MIAQVKVVHHALITIVMFDFYAAYVCLSLCAHLLVLCPKFVLRQYFCVCLIAS
jgi:hypothetical protein